MWSELEILIRFLVSVLCSFAVTVCISLNRRKEKKLNREQPHRGTHSGDNRSLLSHQQNILYFVHVKYTLRDTKCDKRKGEEEEKKNQKDSPPNVNFSYELAHYQSQDHLLLVAIAEFTFLAGFI